MNQENIKKFLEGIDVPVEDSRFYPKLFDQVTKARKNAQALEADNLKRVVTEEYEELSHRLDDSKVQDSVSVRNILRTRRLANLLIDDNGRLNESLLPGVINHLQEHMYSLGPDRQYDAKRQQHLLRVLELLRDDKKLRLMLRRIGKPHMHKYADQIIRDTLQISSKTMITDAHARRAVLSAWLCTLRQSVGSCFATAPAIIVHDEQPEVFLQDLYELLGSGRLKRTFGGIEYAVPLSYSWGAGDLRRMFLFSEEMFDEEVGIWLSPGFEAAFEVVGIFEEEEGERVAVIKRLIQQTMKEELLGQSYALVTAEQVLRKVLLRHFELTEQDVRDYEERPRGMIHGGLLMTVGQTEAAAGGKGKLCAKFIQQLQIASNAFKAFADNALLKSWEFTVASFAETKAQFTRWNLYSSLGLAADDEGGIGPCLYHILNMKLEECNQKVHELQYEYEQAYTQLQFFKNRVRSAQDEKQAKWYRAEYQAKANEFYTLEEIRDKTHFKAKRYANLFNDLVELYYKMFPKYFQEIYDADMLEVTTGPYDDSPAGFRLLYKHGRENTAQWSRIQNHIQFTDSLAAFFTASETEIAGSPEMEGLEDDIGEITTVIVNHVRTKEFIETAFWRMAKIHKGKVIRDPLENLDQVEKKPWVYTSGGAMTTLVSCYFKLEDKPTEASRWVENPTELLTFLVDTIKQIPEKITDEYIKEPNKSMLIHSPTHAFLLKPGLKPFQDAWTTKEFTYTWLRDRLIQPMKDFTAQMFIEHHQMQYLINRLLRKVPKNYQPYFKQHFGNIHGSMLVRDFRDHIVDSISSERGLRSGSRGILSSDDIDSALFETLPLFPSYQLEERVEKILARLPGLTGKNKKNMLKTLKEISGKIGGQKILSSSDLRDYIKAMICIETLNTSSRFDYPLEINRAMQGLGYSISIAITFADTNWVRDEFGFVVNPGTGNLELWRVDYTGSVGAPMSMWQEWLNGSRKEPDWGIYTKPFEYTLQM